MVHPLSPPALLPRGEVKMMKVLFTLVAAGLCICAFGDGKIICFNSNFGPILAF